MNALTDLTKRVTKLEATVAAMNGIDEPTIDRCLASLRNSIDELVYALETTAHITDTPEAIRRANAANLADSHIRALERDLAHAEDGTEHSEITLADGSRLPLQTYRGAPHA